MSESDERLDAVSDKIDEARDAAAPLAEKHVIEPDAVFGEVPASGDEVHGPDDGTGVSGPDVPDTDPDADLDAPQES